MDTITPAYGRDYTSLKDALADWNAGKDFLLNTSTRGIPCNIQDMEREDASHLRLRFDNLRKVCPVKRGKAGWVKA